MSIASFGTERIELWSWQIYRKLQDGSRVNLKVDKLYLSNLVSRAFDFAYLGSFSTLQIDAIRGGRRNDFRISKDLKLFSKQQAILDSIHDLDSLDDTSESLKDINGTNHHSNIVIFSLQSIFP
jgi:hypothetical protein